MDRPEILNIKKVTSCDGWLVIIKQGDKTHIYIVKFSTRKGKKYDVYEFDKNSNTFDYSLSFGSARHEQYYDILRGYDELDHKDEKRRISYFKRHKSHKNNLDSAKYWSHVILWADK